MRLDIAAVVNLVTHSLPLSQWGLAESVKTDSYVIYNSQWCRVKFYIDIDGHTHWTSLWVYYGRLHALDNEWTMKWKGRYHYCWHDSNSDLKEALQFLDGVSPGTAYKTRWQRLPLLDEFHNSESGKNLIRYPDEYTLQSQALIWKHYGVHLFELFDLRRPDLWEKYTDFLKEYYTLDEKEARAAYKQKGIVWEPPFNPPRYKRC